MPQNRHLSGQSPIMARYTPRKFLLMETVSEVVAGGIEAQTRQTLDNLKHTLECANSSMDAVLQVLIYVTDRDYLKTVNQVYAEYFKAPYPNRAALVISGLAREEMLVELVVYAAVP